MTYRGKWTVIGMAIAPVMIALSALPSFGETLATPIRGQQRYQISSSTQPDHCDRANAQPRVVQVDVREPLTQLSFVVAGNDGQPTLRVVDDSTGRETCVTADNLSESRVELTAAWEGNAETGRTYSVFVGDYNGEPHNFTLTIQQN